MPEPDRQTIIVPTYLGRRDADLDKIGLFFTGIAAYWAHQPENLGIPWEAMALPLLLIAVEVLSGEQATEWKFLGSVATGLRSKLGHRRAHEWAQAAWHYWRLAIYPVWRDQCVAFSAFLRLRTTTLYRNASARIRWIHLRACSWAARMRSRSSHVLARLQKRTTGPSRPA